MKKIMFIAVMMAAMLMPGQMMARNNAKARIENRANNRREFKAESRRYDRQDKKYAKAKPKNKHNKKFRNNKPMRRPKPIIVNRPPAPRPIPPRPRPVIYHNHCCDNDVVEATATIIGIAALAAMIAD